MALDTDVCYRAFMSRDRRFDGRFVTAVVTTGVYCRPGCPARTPARRNVRFYPHAAAAESAGFRPCLRCRPETSPGGAAWNGTSATVTRALRLIDEGAMDGAGVEALAGRLGVTSRWLRQLFLEHLGASPLAVARTRRVHFARRLLDQTALPLVEIALASGFGSARRLHDAIRATFHRAPGDLRRSRSAGTEAARGDAVTAPANDSGVPSPITLRLAARAPFDAAPVVRFLGGRAIPGVEQTVDGRYARSVRLDGTTGVIEADAIAGESALRLVVRLSSHRALLAVATRVGRLFDLDADTAAIAEHLRRDRRLARVVPRAGVRVPGSWDPFEIGVRAMLGQQISVAAARTIAGRLVRLCGTPLAVPHESITHVFPEAMAVAAADLESIGLPRARSAALRGFAAAVAQRRIDFAAMHDLDTCVRELTALPGIGPWTAHYIAMRALGEPDAFPASDLGVLKALARTDGTLPSEREALAHAAAWRPWRAYAVIALWTHDPEEER